MTALQIAKEAIKALSSKKAQDIKLIDVKEVTILGDYFVVAQGTNSTQVKALAEEVEYKLKKQGVMPDRIEGRHSDTWILIDYNNVIIHIFLEETRKFYDIEHMWSDGKVIDYE